MTKQELQEQINELKAMFEELRHAVIEHEQELLVVDARFNDLEALADRVAEAYNPNFDEDDDAE